MKVGVLIKGMEVETIGDQGEGSEGEEEGGVLVLPHASPYEPAPANLQQTRKYEQEDRGCYIARGPDGWASGG